jgi:hypothetical protein
MRRIGVFFGIWIPPGNSLILRCTDLRKVDTTLDYKIIGMKRHDTLTRRIQQICQEANKKTDVAAALKNRCDKVVEIKSKETAA